MVIFSDILNHAIDEVIGDKLSDETFKTGKVVLCQSSQDAWGRLLETSPTPSTPTTPLEANEESTDLGSEV